MNLPAKSYLSGPGTVFEEPVIAYMGGPNDEYLTPAGIPHKVATALHQYLTSLSHNQLLSEKDLLQEKIAYHPLSSTSHQTNPKESEYWSLDPLPHVIHHDQWQDVQQGIIQRISALNMFIEDFKNDQYIFHDHVLPEKLLEKLSQQYFSTDRPSSNDYGSGNAMLVWASTDIVRDSSGQYRASGHNLCNPGSMAHMLANRQLMKNTSNAPFVESSVLPIGDFTIQLQDALTALSPNNTARIGILTNGIDCPQYSQMSYLARQLNGLLIEPRDLFVSSSEGYLYADTLDQSQRIDVLLLGSDDPNTALLGQESYPIVDVADLLSCWNNGKVALANAPFTRLASNPIVLSYLPELISYYMNEKILLPTVTTYRCKDDHELAYVLDHMDDLVIHGTDDNGRITTFKAQVASRDEKQRMFKRINEQPYNFVANPIPTSSTAPTVTDTSLQPLSVTVTAYSVHGAEPYVTQGGLTRLGADPNIKADDISRSQQTKDTWVVEC